MIIKCTRCCDDKVVKNGKAPSGSQKYKCKTCNYAFVLKPKNAPISEEKKALVDRLLKENLSLAGIARAAKVGKTWLQDDVSKKYNNRPLAKHQRVNSKLQIPAIKLNLRPNLFRLFLYLSKKILKRFMNPMACSLNTLCFEIS